MNKYQQIISDIEKQIKIGKLQRGEKLPSIRTLSAQYSCNKDTVQRALLELKFQHIIYAKPKSGYYVLGDENEYQDLEVLITDGHEQAYEDFRLCVNETLIGRENYLFNYYHRQEGLEELQQSVQKLLTDGAVYTQLNNIVITSGTQQALSILSQIDFPNGREKILVEQPTYSRMNELVQSQHLPYASIERTPEGIHLAALEEIFQTEEIKFFYMIPRLHNPLGQSLSRKEKEDILNLANRYNVYIVEDDYLADFDRQKKLPLHYLDTQNRVIYIKSFSSILFPALRVAACVLPSSIKEPFIRYKNAMDYDNNLIMQKALSLYIDNLMFAKNRQLLLSMEEKQELSIKNALKQSPLPLPYHLSSRGILLDLRGQTKIPQLKHSYLPLNFFESSYLNPCPYDYAYLPYSTNFADHLKKVRQLLI